MAHDRGGAAKFRERLLRQIVYRFLYTTLEVLPKFCGSSRRILDSTNQFLYRIDRAVEMLPKLPTLLIK